MNNEDPDHTNVVVQGGWVLFSWLSHAQVHSLGCFKRTWSDDLSMLIPNHTLYIQICMYKIGSSPVMIMHFSLA